MTRPLVMRSGKPQCSRRWASHLALMASHQKSISTGMKQCSISSRICSPIAGERDSTAGPQGCSHCLCLSVQKQGRKIRLFKYRGITLLSTAGKLLARVPLNRLIPTIAQENTPESQCGFRSNRGTVDMIFVLKQIQEKCREQNMVYMQLS